MMGKATEQLKRERLERMIFELFGDDERSWFSKKPLPIGCIEDFAKHEEVIRQAADFENSLKHLWRKLHSDKEPLSTPIIKHQYSKLDTVAPQPAPSRSHRPGDSMASPPPNSSTPATPTNSDAGKSIAQNLAPPVQRPPAEAAKMNPTTKPGPIPAQTQTVPQPIPVTATFPLVNAKAGEKYGQRVDGLDSRGRAVRVHNVVIPDGTGLEFDLATCSIRGTPLTPGDHPLQVVWEDQDGNPHKEGVSLTIIANPRDLWKTIDPNPNDPYFKPNEDSRLIRETGFCIAAASKRGRSHAHAGTSRDDDFFIHHIPESGWSVLIVADGAGSAKSSRKGAQLAVQEAGKYIQEQLQGAAANEILRLIDAWNADNAAGSRPLQSKLYDLLGRAAHGAVSAIGAEAQATGSPFKDYSTTLLAAFCRQDAGGLFVASFWLGDGAICAYTPRGQAVLLGVPDSGEFAGQTRFLDKATMSDADGLWNRIQFQKFSGPTALLLMTDGVSDPRFETDNGLADPARWDALWDEISPALADTEPEKRLVEWLDFFTPGHHDDRTIALLWPK